MARRTLPTAIEFDGPFFTKQARLSYLANVRAFMDELAAVGEADIKAQIAAIPPRGIRTGRTRERYRGRTVSLAGKRWQYTLVISPDTTGLGGAEAKAVMAAASEIEQRHRVVRRTKARLLRLIRSLRNRDLTKGLN
jgi:hypothetical protein